MDIDDISSELESSYIPVEKKESSELCLRESYWPMRIFRELDSRISYAWDWCWEVAVSPLTLGTWSKGAWRSNPITYLAYRVIRLIGVTLAPILGLAKLAHNVFIRFPINLISTTDFFYFHGQRRHLTARIHDFIHWKADLYAHLELFDASGELPFIDRIEDVAKALKQHDSDVVFLSNVDSASASALCDELQNQYTDFFLDIGRRQKGDGSNMFIASRAELTKAPEYIVVDLSKEYGKKAGFFLMETPHQLFIVTDLPEGDTGLKERLRTFFIAQIVDYLKKKDSEARIEKEVFIVGDLAINSEIELNRMKVTLEEKQVKLQGSGALLKVHLHPGLGKRGRVRSGFDHEGVKHKYATINELHKFVWSKSYHEKGEGSADFSDHSRDNSIKDGVSHRGEREDKGGAILDPSTSRSQAGERVEKSSLVNKPGISASGEKIDTEEIAPSISSRHEGFSEDKESWVAPSTSMRGWQIEEDLELKNTQNSARVGQREDREPVIYVPGVSVKGQAEEDVGVEIYPNHSSSGQRVDEERVIDRPSKSSSGQREDKELPADTSTHSSRGQREDDAVTERSSAASAHGAREEEQVSVSDQSMRGYGERNDEAKPTDRALITGHGTREDTSLVFDSKGASDHGKQADEPESTDSSLIEAYGQREEKSDLIDRPQTDQHGQREEDSYSATSKNQDSHGHRDDQVEGYLDQGSGQSAQGQRSDSQVESDRSEDSLAYEQEREQKTEKQESDDSEKSSKQQTDPVKTSPIKPPFFR